MTPRRPPHTSFVSLTPSQQEEVEQLSQTPGWRALSKAELPSFFPEDLRERLDSAVVVTSSTMASDRTYVVCNGIRPDPRSREIDHEPFVVSVLSSGASTGGMFVHHGDWDGRTESAPTGFWEVVQESGVGDYFLPSPPSGRSSGTLAELSSDHRAAFYRAVGLLQDYE